MLEKGEEGTLDEEAPSMVPVMGNEFSAKATAGVGRGAEMTGLREVYSVGHGGYCMEGTQGTPCFRRTVTPKY